MPSFLFGLGVGSAGGAVLALLVGLLSFWWFFRRSHHHQHSQSISPVSSDLSEIPRFTIGNDEPDEKVVAPEMHSVGSQANCSEMTPLWAEKQRRQSRPLPVLIALASEEDSIRQMSNDEILSLLRHPRGPLKIHQLEKTLGDEFRAVHIRRKWFSERVGCSPAMDSLPYEKYDYSYVSSACCENVLGYIPVPIGYAGPLRVNGRDVFIPMATTEGCLVASTNRGCSAIRQSGTDVISVVHKDGMTRAPIVRFSDVRRAQEVKEWAKRNFRFMEQTFTATSRFAKLQSVNCLLVDRMLHMRFVATTGDAMGMNMVSKGTEAVLGMMKEKHFPDMEVVSLSGNCCTDKKAAAINWIEGRGKSVVAETTLSKECVHSVLRSSVGALVDLNQRKNLIGSAMAGALGGFNAHAANVVAAIFIATGQDAAQTVSSSQCLTVVEETASGALRISCSMPSLEVGTVGGGTILPAQHAALQIIGCAGGNQSEPGANAREFASVICAAVLAGELSLLAALTQGELVKSHIRLNRSQLNLKCMGQRASEVARSMTNMAEASLKGANLHPESCSKVLT